MEENLPFIRKTLSDLKQYCLVRKLANNSRFCSIPQLDLGKVLQGSGIVLWGGFSQLKELTKVTKIPS